MKKLTKNIYFQRLTSKSRKKSLLLLTTSFFIFGIAIWGPWWKLGTAGLIVASTLFILTVVLDTLGMQANPSRKRK